jgi:hypothetical protein
MRTKNKERIVLDTGHIFHSKHWLNKKTVRGRMASVSVVEEALQDITTYKHKPAMATGVHPSPILRGSAFVYVVADGLGFLAAPDAIRNCPALLMLNHKPHGILGIPGGLADAKDNGNLKTTAQRELTEEMLNISGVRMQKQAAVELRSLMQSQTIKMLQNYKSMGAYLMHVSTAEAFEIVAERYNKNINRLATIPQKLRCDPELSTEMFGYSWIMLDDIAALLADPVTDQNGLVDVVVRGQNPRPLKVRNYSFGHKGGDGVWRPNKAILKILDRFKIPVNPKSAA